MVVTWFDLWSIQKWNFWTPFFCKCKTFHLVALPYGKHPCCQKTIFCKSSTLIIQNHINKRSMSKIWLVFMVSYNWSSSMTLKLQEGKREGEKMLNQLGIRLPRKLPLVVCCVPMISPWTWGKSKSHWSMEMEQSHPINFQSY